jgi:hypothetical protein
LHHTVVANDTVLAQTKREVQSTMRQATCFQAREIYNKFNLHSTTNNVEMENME